MYKTDAANLETLLRFPDDFDEYSFFTILTNNTQTGGAYFTDKQNRMLLFQDNPDSTCKALS